MKTKKELKDEYKQIKFKMGVFQIRNTINGKIFVGSSTNLDAIWNRSRTQLDFGSHVNSNLQKDWKEFGEVNFKFEILSEIKQKEMEIVDYNSEVKVLEEMYLEQLKPYDDKGYNRFQKTK
ncbi:MAG: GIY-YIG nuclease family protein [Nitrospirae bacterium]|nr:GIY-YIG nuclease family protein [Nitrospirota bacterium]